MNTGAGLSKISGKISKNFPFNITSVWPGDARISVENDPGIRLIA